MPEPWDFGGFQRSFAQGRQAQQQIETGDVDAAAQTAAGNALVGMFGSQSTPGQMPGGQPGMPPQGQPGMPPGGGMPPRPGPPQGPPGAPPMGQAGPAPQQGNMLATLLQRLRGGAGGGPPPAQAMPPGPPQQGAVPGAQPMQPPPGGQPPMGGPPGGQQGQGGLPSGGQGPQLGWQQIVQGVIKSNPGVKDPRVIAAAVDRFLPLMNQQTQQQWKEVSMQLRQSQMDLQEQRIRMQEDQGQQKIDQAGKRIDQGDKRLDQGDKKIDQAGSREQRLERESVLRQDQQHQMLQIRQQQLAQQIQASKDRTQLGQWRALLDAQHKRAQETISSAAAGMDATERKRLMGDEDKYYADQINEMRSAMGEGGGKPKADLPDDREFGGGQGAAPVKVKTPEDAGKLKPGTRYVTPDGQEYTR